MRAAASGSFFLAATVIAGHAAAAPITVDLPAGTMSSAMNAVAERANINIGTTTSGLLGRTIPAFHCKGSPGTIVRRLARSGGLEAISRGPGNWLIAESRSRPRQVARPSGPEISAGRDIVVEATKNGDHLATFPAEVVRLAGVDVSDFGTPPDSRQLAARIPTLASTDWGSGHDKIFLRGIADSSFTGASPALVGQYWGDQRLNLYAPDPDILLYDVASVEVLEGPQGTLYGSDTLSGLVRVEPEAPDTTRTAGWVALGYQATAHGSGAGDAQAMLNLPIAHDLLAFRAVGYDVNQGGYIDDAGRGLSNVNHVHIRGGRAALRWQPGSGWSVDLSGLGQRIDSRDAPYADAGAAPLSRTSRIPQPSYNQLISGQLAISGEIGEASLRSTSGVVFQRYGERYEALQGYDSFLFIGDDRARIISQESHVSGRSPFGSWLVGISLLASRDDESRLFGRSRITAPQAEVHSNTTEMTGYGQWSRTVLPGFSLTFGARVSRTRASSTALGFQSPFHQLITVTTDRSALTSWHALPSAAISYMLTPGTTLFLRYSTGFRPGGTSAGETVTNYHGDHVGTLEAGMRHGVLRRDPLAFTLTVSRTRWSNVQADLLDGLGIPYIANIGDGHIETLDGEIALRMGQHWLIDASGFVSRNRLDATPEVALQGNADRLPNVAREGEIVAIERTGSVSSGVWKVGLRVQHVGHSLFGLGPFLDQVQGGYATAALGGELRFGRTEFDVDASNLLDSHHNAFAVGTPLAGLVRQQITPLRPRTVRIGARYDF